MRDLAEDEMYFVMRRCDLPSFLSHSRMLSRSWVPGARVFVLVHVCGYAGRAEHIFTRLPRTASGQAFVGNTKVTYEVHVPE
jgi:hypothetical protein